tara:strand:+ start:1126 stop:2142 length:1017 start_codon:yes stop_codon:yes gene_type:complete
MDTKEVTIFEKTNSVKNTAIAIRPYFNPAKENMGLENYDMSLFEGAVHSESIACLEKNGITRYITGLNEFAPEIKMLPASERKAKIEQIRKTVIDLEKELAANVIKIDDPEFWAKVMVVKPDNGAFWNKIELKCGNDPVFIDPVIDPYDKIKLLAIEAGGFSLIAPNLETAKATGKYKFYLDKVSETIGTRTKDSKIKNKALGLLSDMYDEDKTKLLHIVKLIDVNSSQYTDASPLDMLYEVADAYINARGIEKDTTRAAKNFIKFAGSKMESLKLNSLVKDALACSLLSSKSDGYIYDKKSGLKISSTREGVVEHLKNPANDEMLERLLGDVNDFLN